jgi:hypothetical protein
MKRFWLALVVSLVLGSGAVSAYGAGPRLAFHKGEVLVYGVLVKEGGDTTLEGTATLTVLAVKPDGTANIKQDIVGAGKLEINNKMTTLPKSTSGMILVVKPNGTISDFQDAAGKSLSIKERRKSLFDAAGRVSEKVDVMRTFFGLQLPEKEVAPGAKWAGKQQEESAFSSDLEHWQTKLTPVSVAYKFAGTRQYLGVSCMVISYDSPEMGPATIYFDAAKGRVVGTAVGDATAKDADTVSLKSYTPGAGAP